MKMASPAAVDSALTGGWVLLQDFAGVAGAQGVGALFSALGAALLEGLSFSLLIPLLGVVFGTGAPMGAPGNVMRRFFEALPEVPSTRLLLLLLLFSVLMSVRAAVMGLRDVSIIALQVRFTGALRLRLAERLAATRWDYIARLRHARVTQLMGSDIQRLAIGVEFMLRGGAAAALLIAQCLLMLLMAPALAAAVLLMLFLGLIALHGFSTRVRGFGGFALEANLALLDRTAQFLGGLKLAMSQGLESSFVRETAETLGNLAERQNQFMRQQVATRAGLAVIAALVGSALLFAGYRWFGVPPATLVALSLVGTRMVGPVEQIQQGVQQFANALPVYDSLRVLEGELDQAADKKNLAHSDYPDGPVTFRHVCHRHTGNGSDGKGLDDFSLTLMPGECLGVTGLSGAGKTTFADLLAGLYPPDQGEILAGGRNLDNGTLTAWRQKLSYVSQDPFLFHESIRRNLAWANPSADEEAMWQVLALAGAEDLVRGLHKGLDTPVGERGALVSGGERQRIALARALLRKPRLLLLDEATNALDSRAERLLLGRLATLNPRPTIVVIAHRGENLDLCNRTIIIGHDTAGDVYNGAV